MVDVKKFLVDNGLKIVNNASNQKNVIVLILEGDVNDGDYVTKETSFSLENEEDRENLKLVLQVMRESPDWDFKFCDDNYYYESDDSLTDEDKQLYEKFELIVHFPCDRWSRCHTITKYDLKYYDEFGIVHDLISE